MPSIDVSFFATDSEICEWLQFWVSKHNLSMVALRHPFSMHEVLKHEIADAVKDITYWRFALSVRHEWTVARYQDDFYKHNSDLLILDLGRFTSDGLKESWLSCRVDDEATFRCWQSIARNLKRQTMTGVTLISRQSGISKTTKTWGRYSQGAKALHDSGISMLSIQGIKGPIIKLGID